jgi:hypothetical protein
VGVVAKAIFSSQPSNPYISKTVGSAGALFRLLLALGDLNNLAENEKKIFRRLGITNYFRSISGYIFDPTVPDGVMSDMPDHLPSKVLDCRNNFTKLVRDITNF